MSYSALNWAWQADIPTGPKMVLVALADQAGYKEDTDSLVTVAGQERLAAMASMSVRSVARHMAWLSDRGYIARTTRRRPDGYRTSDSTVLNLDADTAANDPDNTTSLPVSGDNLSVSDDNLSPDSSADLTGQLGRPHLTQCLVLKEPPVEPPVDPGRATRGPATSTSSKTTKGRRLPDEFAVDDDMRRWAFENFPWLDLDQATAEFVDYWRAVPGAKGVKLDWPATWRNSIRKTAERVPDWRRKQLVAERRPTPRPVPGVYPGDPDDVEAYLAWTASFAQGGAR